MLLGNTTPLQHTVIQHCNNRVIQAFASAKDAGQDVIEAFQTGWGVVG